MGRPLSQPRPLQSEHHICVRVMGRAVNPVLSELPWLGKTTRAFAVITSQPQAPAPDGSAHTN
jgi:hypothetical protein